MGKIPNLRFCNGQNLGDIFICPVVRDAPLDIKGELGSFLKKKKYCTRQEGKVCHVPPLKKKFVMAHPWKKKIVMSAHEKKKFVMPQKGPEIMHLARKIQNFDQARRQTPEKQDNWKCIFAINRRAYSIHCTIKYVATVTCSITAALLWCFCGVQWLFIHVFYLVSRLLTGKKWQLKTRNSVRWNDDQLWIWP